LSLAFNLKSPAKTLRERFLQHLGHALRTSQREKSARVKLSSMVVQEFGEHELRYTRGGAATMYYLGVQPLYSLQFCERLLGHRIGDNKKLMDLAQRREKWRQLAKSL
jgi:hypothetical protein